MMVINFPASRVQTAVFLARALKQWLLELHREWL
jgi:hypothetical protein